MATGGLNIFVKLEAQTAEYYYKEDKTGCRR
jgi:hypothetical protein